MDCSTAALSPPTKPVMANDGTKLLGVLVVPSYNLLTPVFRRLLVKVAAVIVTGAFAVFKVGSW